MVDNIGSQTRKAEANYRLWVNPTYYKSSSEALFDVDADIWGIEAGGDLQHDVNNRLGLFVSYRNGDYDMNGKGKHYSSTIGSEIEIDSYLAGLYYRYDKNNWWAFATLYGGMQEADLKTKDGVKSDTDGIEFGGSAEVGYDYALQEDLYLTPSLGVYYTQVNFDDATLGRIELGGRYGLSKVLSAYGWANYTFGSDYDATTFGVGLNYAF